MDILSYSRQMFRLAAEGQTQGVFYWAAIYAFLICSYSLWFQVRTRSWPSTNGSLKQLGIEKFGATVSSASNQDYIGKALYTYTVSGKPFEGSRISPWVFVASHNARYLLSKQQSKIRFDPDGEVRVYYNPKNPQKSYLQVAGKTGIIVTMLLGAAPIVFYWFRYHA